MSSKTLVTSSSKRHGPSGRWPSDSDGTRSGNPRLAFEDDTLPPSGIESTSPRLPRRIPVAQRPVGLQGALAPAHVPSGFGARRRDSAGGFESSGPPSVRAS